MQQQLLIAPHSSHNAALTHSLAALYASAELCDVTLTTDELRAPRIQVHRVVVAAASPVLRRMLSRGFAEASSNIVTIREVSGSALRGAIDSCYGLPVKVPNLDALLRLCQVADLLQLTFLRESCIATVKELCAFPECAASIFGFGHQFYIDELRELGLSLMLAEFDVASRSGAFLELEPELLVEIIQRDDLPCSEELIFEAVMRWLMFDPDRMPQMAGNILPFVRFSQMSTDYLSLIAQSTTVPVIENLSVHALRIKRSKGEPIFFCSDCVEDSPTEGDDGVLKRIPSNCSSVSNVSCNSNSSNNYSESNRYVFGQKPQQEETLPTSSPMQENDPYFYRDQREERAMAREERGNSVPDSLRSHSWGETASLYRSNNETANSSSSRQQQSSTSHTVHSSSSSLLSDATTATTATATPFGSVLACAFGGGGNASSLTVTTVLKGIKVETSNSSNSRLLTLDTDDFSPLRISNISPSSSSFHNGLEGSGGGGGGGGLRNSNSSSNPSSSSLAFQSTRTGELYCGDCIPEEEVCDYVPVEEQRLQNFAIAARGQEANNYDGVEYYSNTFFNSDLVQQQSRDDEQQEQERRCSLPSPSGRSRPIPPSSLPQMPPFRRPASPNLRQQQQQQMCHLSQAGGAAAQLPFPSEASWRDGGIASTAPAQDDEQAASIGSTDSGSSRHNLHCNNNNSNNNSSRSRSHSPASLSGGNNSNNGQMLLHSNGKGSNSPTPATPPPNARRAMSSPAIRSFQRDPPQFGEGVILNGTGMEVKMINEMWRVARNRRGFDTDGAKVVGILSGHSKAVGALVRIGERIVSGSYDTIIRVWDMKNMACEQELRLHTQAVITLCACQNEQVLASGSHDNRIVLWQVQQQIGAAWNPLRVIEAHLESVHTLVSDDSFLYSGGGDCTIRVWSLGDWNCVRTLTGHTDWVYALESLAGMLISGGCDGILKVWCKTSWNKMVEIVPHQGRDILAITSTPTFVITSGADHAIKIWSLDWTLVRSLHGHVLGASMLIVVANGEKLLSGSFDKTIKVWNLLTGECERELEMDHPVCMLAAIDKRLCTGTSSGDIQVLQ